MKPGSMMPRDPSAFSSPRATRRREIDGNLGSVAHDAPIGSRLASRFPGIGPRCGRGAPPQARRKQASALLFVRQC